MRLLLVEIRGVGRGDSKQLNFLKNRRGTANIVAG
jgi:hypothetical protein